MDAHGLRVLEYDKIVGIVAGYTLSAPGRQAVAGLVPSADREAVARLLGETREYLGLLRTGERAPLDGIKDIGGAVSALRAAGSMLPGGDLLDIASTLAAGRRVKLFFERREGRPREPQCPLVGAIAARIRPLPDIEKTIIGAIDEAGEVRDSASPDLRRVRKQLRRVREEILDRMEGILRRAEAQKVLQDSVITQRDDRYVLPLKPNFRQIVKGVVHGQSGTRATVFVEPLEVLEQNNRLAELKIEERDEVERILRSLAALVAKDLPAVEEAFAALAKIDAISARALFGVEFGGTVPDLSVTQRIALRQARHPLLLWKQRHAGSGPVAANDIELDAGHRVLIISGPNAGGKTVVLKTAGLLCLMAQSGLPVTASEGSEVPVFDTVFADIGDEQSIEESLSTFSAHAAVVATVLRQAKEGSLVLLDELGAGTDPAEGAALAAAVLDELLLRRCLTVVTTHHGALKVFGARTGGAVNAAMEFDPQTLTPTYRLLAGRPGRSYGLDMAGRLGVPREVVERARARIGEAETRLDSLLEQIERDSRITAERRDETDRQLTQARKDRDEAERLLSAARDEARTELRKTRSESREVLAALRRKLRDLAETASLEKETIKDLSRETEALARKLDGEQPALKKGPAAAPHDLKRGDRVRIARLNATGTVLDIRRDTVELDVAGKTLTLPAHEVAIMGAAPPSAPMGQGWTAELEESRGTPDRVNVIGSRVDEAVEEVARALDRTALEGFSSLTVIHGIGTGALKAAVTELLRGHPFVAAVRPGRPAEGGAGVTVAELKK
jgi:DNA mismatch repair protein MutS2